MTTRLLREFALKGTKDQEGHVLSVPVHRRQGHHCGKQKSQFAEFLTADELARPTTCGVGPFFPQIYCHIGVKTPQQAVVMVIRTQENGRRQLFSELSGRRWVAV
jgi:hypothetical protein